MSVKQYFICSCFFSRNIFLEGYKLHINFRDKQQFIQDYAELLKERGLTTTESLSSVLKEITDEIDRRRQQDKISFERKQLIAAKYSPLHPHLYTLHESFFSPVFLDLFNFSKQDGICMEKLVKSSLIQDLSERIYSFPVFTEEFCQLFLEEICNFENSNLPKGRPNTMNNYGILLSELGFDDNFITPLREKYLAPICSLLYPDCGGNYLDSQRAFIVFYKPGQDVSLSHHFDNAEVTLNVSLGKAFKGGELVFWGLKHQSPEKASIISVDHNPSHGILHRGLHIHSAETILAGERYNLIIWMRSSHIRNKLCPRCDMKPSLTPALGFGDGFTMD